MGTIIRFRFDSIQHHFDSKLKCLEILVVFQVHFGAARVREFQLHSQFRFQYIAISAVTEAFHGSWNSAHVHRDNAFDATWCTCYCHMLSTINETSNPNRDGEWTSLITTYLHHLITHFNKSNKHSSLVLPCQRSGMRTHTGNQPPPELNFSKNQKNDLRPDFAHSWCRPGDWCYFRANLSTFLFVKNVGQKIKNL